MKLGTRFPVNGSHVDVRSMFCWLFLSRYMSGEGYALSSASCLCKQFDVYKQIFFLINALTTNKVLKQDVGMGL